MTCFSPIAAWQLDCGEIVFAERGKVRRELSLPCGQCIGCRLLRSRDWAIRCMHEAQCHEANAFITLTYADEFVPVGGDLVYRHFQLFMKRLRSKTGLRVRFFMCGEYGEKYQRPHFHAILFGIAFGDRVLWSDGGEGHKLYRSELLESCWPHGHSSVADVSFATAAYVARYCCSKVTGEAAHSHYERIDCITGEIYNVTPEFGRMSLKPGIGAEWFEKFKSDVYPEDYCVVDGMKIKPPKAYDRYLMALPSFESDWLEFSRYQKRLRCSDDSTYERLRAREVVTRARLATKVRSLE